MAFSAQGKRKGCGEDKTVAGARRHWMALTALCARTPSAAIGNEAGDAASAIAQHNRGSGGGKRGSRAREGADRGAVLVAACLHENRVVRQRCSGGTAGRSGHAHGIGATGKH
jgi:hypothetical protein